ncbi:ATP-binding protein [Novosphingobium sp.]|uniref:ATP-binding protein n=1 Tax=Novosphingobium sp. TaxID=1874826 RepID=UPI0038BBBF55
MPSLWIVIAAIAAYLVVLIAIGWRADRLAVSPMRERLRPALHGLSLATLCSAWTYFGAVGDASKGSWLFVANALGPILAITVGYSVWRRIARLAKRENVGSLADFLAARYGKSRSLGILAAVVAGLGALPYIALQLTVLTSTWHYVGGRSDQAGWQTAGLTAVLAAIAIFFGARRPSLTQHNRGLVGMLAFESVVKLTGLLGVAGLALLLFSRSPMGIAHSFAEAMPVRPMSGGAFLTLVMLCTVTAFTLPRQFHLSFVAIENVEDSRSAAWIVPVYFTLWVAATLVIAVAIRAGYGEPGVTPQLQVLGVPAHAGYLLIALLALLGGLSAGAAMVVVELTAVSAMVSNEIVLPLLSGTLGSRPGEADAGRAVVRVRRWTIVAMAALAWCYFLGIRTVEGPTELGLTALTAFAQLMPALIGGIYWRRGHAHGAIAGIMAGMAVWALAIAAPAFVANDGQFASLALGSLWPSPGWPTELAVWFSLALNGSLYIVVSLRTVPRLIDTIQANSFVEESGRAPLGDGRQIKATVAHLRALLVQFLGRQEADKALREFNADARHGALGDQQSITPALARAAERLLAGVIGAPSARNVVAIALAVDSQDANEISSILDEAGHAVHFNRELLQTTLDSLPQAVSVLDAQLALVAWNAAFLRFLSIAVDDVHVGKSLPALVRAGGRSAAAQETRERLLECAAAVRAGAPVVTEHDVGEGLVVQIAGRGLAGGDFLLTLTDVSDLRAAEHVLTRSKAELEALVEERTAALVSANLALAEATRLAEQATRSQRRFVASASHDLVQPLHAARLFIGNALVGADDADRATPLLRKADQSVEGAHRLLHALLNLSRLEIGALEPKLEAVDLGDLLQSLAEEFAQQACTRGLELVVLPTSRWVRSDRDLLRAMLQNLMLNALRYTPQGRVVVCTRLACASADEAGDAAGGSVRIEVRDTGVGIASDKLPRAFAEFSRLDEGQSLASGAGLGLSIVARIADVLGHRIAVRSAPGRGSVFSIRAPVSAPVVRAAAPARSVANLAGLRVLCVDDEHDVLAGTSALIERWGASVAAAASCGEALQLPGQWDVVLADYHLGDGDGLSLLRKLRERARLRLLVTATPDAGWIANLGDEGIACLTKPLAPLELQARLVGALQSVQVEDERSRASASN